MPWREYRRQRGVREQTELHRLRPRHRDKRLRQILKKRVNSFAERARKQAALVALIQLTSAKGGCFC